MLLYCILLYSIALFAQSCLSKERRSQRLFAHLFAMAIAVAPPAAWTGGRVSPPRALGAPRGEKSCAPHSRTLNSLARLLDFSTK